MFLKKDSEMKSCVIDRWSEIDEDLAVLKTGRKLNRNELTIVRVCKQSYIYHINLNMNLNEIKMLLKNNPSLLEYFI